MLKSINFIQVLLIVTGWFAVASYAMSDSETKVIAVNIALDPDDTMAQFVKNANQRMLKSYAKGFALDNTHAPHITLLQRFINEQDLSGVMLAVEKAVASEPVKNWRLIAGKYQFNPWDDGYLGSIKIDSDDKLLKLQQKLIATLAPFTRQTGTSDAFYKDAAEPGISQITVDYVANFVPNSSGNNYKPHVTIGLASKHCMKVMSSEAFKSFSFAPAGVSLYQIGNFGTARKTLKQWR